MFVLHFVLTDCDILIPLMSPHEFLRVHVDSVATIARRRNTGMHIQYLQLWTYIGPDSKYRRLRIKDKRNRRISE